MEPKRAVLYGLILIIAVVLIIGYAMVRGTNMSYRAPAPGGNVSTSPSMSSTSPQTTPQFLASGQAIATTSTQKKENAAAFKYEIVDTPALQERGLGGRAAIPHDYGMLFIFPYADKYGFWMKDMLVPIDMIWLSDTGRVLKVDANVSPATYPDVFYPPAPVRYVLETRAGEAKLQGWGIGSTVPLPARK